MMADGGSSAADNAALDPPSLRPSSPGPGASRASRLPPGLLIRPPSALERRAWRMLLPEAAGSPDPCRVLVAAAPFDAAPTDQPVVVGAIALAASLRNAPIGWPRVCLHVIPPLRQRGIAEMLLNTAAEAERQRGLGRGAAGRAGPIALAAWSLVDPNSGEAAVWQSIGFVDRVTFFEQEVDLRIAEARLGPLCEQMKDSGWIPDDARVIPLAAATAEQRQQLASLHLAELGGNEADLLRDLAGRRGSPYDPQLSMVLLHGAKVVGFTLGRVLGDGVCLIEANALAPSHRLGWANVLLKLTATRRLLSRGIATTRFQSCQQHTDTRKIAGQLGAVMKRQSWLLYRVFPPPAAGAGSVDSSR